MICRYFPPKGCGTKRRDVGDLVSHGIAAQILQVGLVQSLALEGDQAYGQAGSVKFQHHGRERAGGKAAEIRHGQIRNGAEVGIRVCAGLKINFDEAHSGQRTRFDVIHAAGQGEKSLEWISDVRFDLLRRHTGIKGGHHDNGNIDGGKRSTGMRTRVTVPTMAMTRQATRLQKKDI